MPVKAPADHQVARNRQHAIEEVLEKMARYYVLHAPVMQDLPVIREDRKAYRGIVHRWFEPLLLNAPNLLLIEEYIGDSWTLRVEKMVTKS